MPHPPSRSPSPSPSKRNAIKKAHARAVLGRSVRAWRAGWPENAITQEGIPPSRRVTVGTHVYDANSIAELMRIGDWRNPQSRTRITDAEAAAAWTVHTRSMAARARQAGRPYAAPPMPARPSGNGTGLGRNRQAELRGNWYAANPYLFGSNSNNSGFDTNNTNSPSPLPAGVPSPRGPTPPGSRTASPASIHLRQSPTPPRSRSRTASPASPAYYRRNSTPPNPNAEARSAYTPGAAAALKRGWTSISARLPNGPYGTQEETPGWGWRGQRYILEACRPPFFGDHWRFMDTDIGRPIAEVLVTWDMRRRRWIAKVFATHPTGTAWARRMDTYFASVAR